MVQRMSSGGFCTFRRVHQYSQSLLPDSSSFSKEWPSSPVRALRQSTGFFGTPGTLSNCAFGWRIVFLRLCPREIRCLRFTFTKIFKSSIRNNLTKPLEVNTFKRDRIKTIFNWLPCHTTSHERPKMSISVGTQCSRGDLRALLLCCQVSSVRIHESLLLGLFKNSFELCKCATRIGRKSVVIS